jgi:CubicO group peptidase (beta-lactamase class C family)
MSVAATKHTVECPPAGGRRFSRRFATRAALAVGLSGLAGVASRGVTGAQATTSSAAAGIDVAAIDDFVRRAMATYRVPGAAVAVVLAGGVALARGYGVRSTGGRDPVDEHTVFQLASNSKPFTAAGLASLVDEGRLGWDDPVARYLPEFVLFDPYATHYATIRDLLAHRTGLPAFRGDLLGVLGYDRPEILRRLRFIEPATSFRAEALYSNPAYFAAGEVLARLTGAPYEQAIPSRLFDPLGMTRSSPATAVTPGEGNVSNHHAEIDGAVRVVPRDDSSAFCAAGGLVSTAADLATWMRMHLAGGEAGGRRLLSPETVADLFRPSMVGRPTFSEFPPIDEHAGFGYGLGWASFHLNGHEVIEKGGALAGVRSVVELVPALGLGVAVLANLNLTALPEAIRAFVLAQALGDDGEDWQTAIRRQSQTLLDLVRPETAPADPGPTSLPLDGYAGAYENDLYGRFVVVADGDGLRLEAGPARYPGTLTHFGYDVFSLGWESATTAPQRMSFLVGPDGQTIGFDTETLGRFARIS